MVQTTVKEVTNPVAGQDADHAGGTDWNQAIQVLKGTHATERIQSSSVTEVPWVTKTQAAVNIVVTEECILADATSNVVALTLPTAVGHLGGHHIIKRIDATFNTVTIVGTGGQTIDGKATHYLVARDEVVDLISDGANWRIAVARRDFVPDDFRARGATLDRYYTMPLTANTASITATVVAATCYAFPFIVTRTVTIDAVKCNCVGTGAGSLFYAALYRDNGNLYPGDLLIDFGGVDTSGATGVKTFTTGIPFTLTPGLYWMAMDMKATAATISGYAAAQVYPILGTTNVLTAAPGLGWTVALAAGAYSNPFPAGGTVIIAVPIPALFFRIS